MTTGALKLTLCGILSLAVARYVPVYYHTMEFNRYVSDQVKRIRSTVPLREAILDKAEEHKIPITSQDITMSTADSVLRVQVDYHMPVNFYVFRQDLRFQAAGSGLLQRN
jgi:hypothetical protein